VSAPDARAPLPVEARPAPAGRPAVRRVGAGMLLSLLAGRGAWRASLALSNLVLLAAWGSAVFARYAAVIGSSVVLVQLVSCGVEKAALKLVPRARLARPLLVGGFLAIGCLLALPFLAWVLVSYALQRPGVGAFQVAVLGFQALLGLNLVLVAMQRALGRPGYDVANFSALAVALLAIAGLAFAIGLTPLGVTVAELLVVACLDVALLRSLPVAPRVRGLRRRPRLLRGLLRTMALIGAYDLAGAAALSLSFVVLAGTRFRGDAGWLLLVTTLWSLLFNGFTYLLRVFQPQVSVALGRGGVDARRYALRLTRLAALGVGGWLLLVAAAALAHRGDVVGWLRGLPLPLLAAAVVLPRLPLLALAGGAGYVLENADARSLRLAAAAAVAALAGVLGLSLLLIPLAGVPGAILALSSFEVLQVVALLAGLSAASAPGRASARERPAGAPGE
jgi:hypothetical protein